MKITSYYPVIMTRDVTATADFYTADGLGSSTAIQLSDLVQTAYLEAESVEEKLPTVGLAGSPEQRQ